PIELVGPDSLARGDLSRYDAIVVGSRAYETDPALVASNGRLVDYARGGGLVIVQYQQYPFVSGNFAPYPLAIARPHDRVTDETARVTPLDPASPVFHLPNEIGPDDWRGWVQERGLYFAHEWDPAYTPLLEMHDASGPPLSGGLLVAPARHGLAGGVRPAPFRARQRAGGRVVRRPSDHLRARRARLLARAVSAHLGGRDRSARARPGGSLLRRVRNAGRHRLRRAGG